VSLIFYADAHVYELDGLRVPSVTGVLQRAGLTDFSHIPPSILGAALERGTQVHRAVHFYNEHDLDVAAFRATFPEYIGYLQAWINFTEQRHFVPVLNEHRVASRRHLVAGTVDCLGVLDGVGVVVDFKTGHPKDVAADLQLAAYVALAMEWASECDEDPALELFFSQHKVVRRHAVQLRADGTFRVETYADPRDFRDFLTLVAAQQIVARRRDVPVVA